MTRGPAAVVHDVVEMRHSIANSGLADLTFIVVTTPVEDAAG